mgnify:CR=1 FL=1
MPQLINSVLGAISPDDLGITLMHEHLIFGFPGWQYDSAAPPYDREETVNTCVEMIKEAKRYGLKTIIDATPNDGTRDPELYKIVAEKAEINIICATGLYSAADGASAYFRIRAGVSKEYKKIINEIYETFMRDICQGIGNSGVRAGVIKIGTSKGRIAPYEEMVMEAAAMAQKDTGVPIITHTEAGTMGPQQADYLISKGAEINRLAIGHMCGNANLKYHLEVLQKGVFICFDRFGFNLAFPDTLRIGTLVGLIGLGYEKHIMLSHDCVLKWLGRKLPVPETSASLVANWNLTHIFKNIIPAMKRANITDERIKTIIIDNPRRLFTGE